LRISPITFGRQLVERHADDRQRHDRRAAHGVDVGEGVGGGDAAEVARVVDDRHEEVGGGDEAWRSLSLYTAASSAVSVPDQQLGRHRPAGMVASISESTAGAILQPQPPPWVVEAESSKIGNRTLPPAVWQAMERAPRIVLSAPIEVRADYLVRSYPDVIADRGLLEQVLSRLEVYPGRKQLATWRELADAGAVRRAGEACGGAALRSVLRAVQRPGSAA
jgi:hypothetical protein